MALEHIAEFRPKIEPIIRSHPYLDGHIAQIATFMNARRFDFLHRMSKITYGGHMLPVPTSQAVLDRLDLRGRLFVTIHNGYDPGFVITSHKATKCYRRFDEVVAHCKARHPNLVFVQIGVATTSDPIDGVDFNLIGKTTLPESAGLIKNAALHIDNEGGLVHLARCLGVQSCVLFGPTPLPYFAYPENVNIVPPECGGCWWINNTWMDQCPRGMKEAECMQHDPTVVASAIITAVETRLPSPVPVTSE